MNILVTGAGGFVGTAFIPKLLEKGHRIFALQHQKAVHPDVIALQGDITEPNLGLKEVPKNISALYHLAGSHRLGEDKDGSIWLTNVAGTRNVLKFCAHHDIPRLYFTSTAYTWECNPYGLSKIQNEREIKEYSEKYGVKTTIFKPSIIMGTEKHPYPGHFSQFVSALIKIHQRAELIRRRFESGLRLPLIRPILRVKGNPTGNLNLVPVDTVAEAMAKIQSDGVYWLTNPNPPTLKQLAEWVSEYILIDFRIEHDFTPSATEKTFAKMIIPFEAYLQGDSFPSSLARCPTIDKNFIEMTVRKLVGL